MPRNACTPLISLPSTIPCSIRTRAIVHSFFAVIPIKVQASGSVREGLPEFFWRQRKPAAHALKKTTNRHRCRLWIKVLIPDSFSHPCLQGLDQKRLLTCQICLQNSVQGLITPGTEGKFRQYQEEDWFFLHLVGKSLQIRRKLLTR